MGCTMEVHLKESGSSVEVTEVRDNGCRRGEEYARKELLNPTRTLTTTVLVNNGTMRVVPVKTSGEVPKDKLMQCMEIIRRLSCNAPVKRGDVILYDILGSGQNVIACADVPIIN